MEKSSLTPDIKQEDDVLDKTPEASSSGVSFMQNQENQIKDSVSKKDKAYEWTFVPDEVLEESKEKDNLSKEDKNYDWTFTPDEEQEEFNPRAYDGSYFMADRGMNNDTMKKFDNFFTAFEWYMKGFKVAKNVDESIAFIENSPREILSIGNKLQKKHEFDDFGDIADQYGDELSVAPIQAAKSFGISSLETTKGMGSVLQILGDNLALSPDSKLVGLDRMLANGFSKGLISAGELIKKASKYGLDSELLKLDEEIFAGSYLENPSITRTLSIVSGALPSLLSGAAIYKVTGSSLLTYGLLASVESGDLYEEAKEIGLGVPQATKLWGISAVGTGVVDLAFKPIEKIFSGKMKATSSRVRKALVDGTREGSTESFQQVWQNMVRKYGVDDSQEFLDGVIESFIGGVGSAGAMSFVSSSSKQNHDSLTTKLKENGASDLEIENFTEAVAREISEKRGVVNPIFEENIEKSVKSLDDYIEKNVSKFEEQKRLETKSQLENIQKATFDDLKKIMPIDEAFANSKLMQAFSLFGANETGLSPSEYYELRTPEVLKKNNINSLDNKEQYFQSDKTPNIEIKGDELGNIANVSELRKVAKEFYRSNLQGKKVVNPNVGEILFTLKGAKKALVTSADTRKVRLFPKLREIVETADFIRSEDVRSIRKDDIVKFHYLSNKVLLDGKPFDVFVTIGEDARGKLFYNINEDIKNPQGNLPVQRQAPEGLQDEKSSYEQSILQNGDGVNIDLVSRDVLEVDSDRRARGYIDFRKDGSALISLLEKADASTFIHEMGHYFLNEMKYFAKLNDDSFRRLQTIDKWLGATNGKYTTEHHEKFARGFEQFLREGEAPSFRLKEVFERFANWLKTVYKSADELNVELNDDIRAIYADIFGGKDLDYFMRDNVSIEQMVEYNRHKAKTDRKKMDEIYSSNVGQLKIKKSKLNRFWEGSSQGAKEFSEFMSDSIVPLEEEVRRISPEIWAKNRKLEISKLDANKKLLIKAKPFIEKMSNIPSDDFYTLDLALKNRDFSKVGDLLKTYKLEKEFSVVRSLLADIRSELIDIGVSVGYLENYYPRVVKKAKDMFGYIEKKYSGTEEWSMIQKAIKEKESDGRVLSDEDRVQIVNSLIRGYGGAITLSNIGSVKTRQIDVIDAEMNQFYKSSTDALVDYLSLSTTLIENKKYFGKESKDIQGLRTRIRGRETRLSEYVAMEDKLAKGKELKRLNYEIGGLDAQIRNAFEQEDKKRLQSRKEYIESQVDFLSKLPSQRVKNITINRMKEELAPLKEELKLKADDTIDKSIGNVILKLVEDGKIKGSQEQRLRDLLTARFSNKGMGNEAFKFIRDMGYINVLGNFESAITQFGDLGTSAWQNGLWNTGVEYVKAWGKKSNIDMDTVGLDKIISNEFSKDVTILSKTLDKTLFLTGFEKMDSVAKQTTMNAAVNKARIDAKKGNKELIDYLKVEFGENYKQVLQDLVDGKQTPEIIEYAMFKLFDVQPVTVDQMPRYYAEGGKKRMFYMMKSYFIKQLNLYRYLAFEKSRTDPAGAIGDMLRLTLYMSLFNTGSDILKDLIFGRPVDIPDTLIGNIFLGGAINKWTVSRFKQEGFSGVLGNFIAPPIFIDTILGDLFSSKNVKDYRVWGNVPVIGRPYYWYVGGGRTKLMKDEQKEKNKGKKNQRKI